MLPIIIIACLLIPTVHSKRHVIFDGDLSDVHLDSHQHHGHHHSTRRFSIPVLEDVRDTETYLTTQPVIQKLTKPEYTDEGPVFHDYRNGHNIYKHIFARYRGHRRLPSWMRHHRKTPAVSTRVQRPMYFNAREVWPIFPQQTSSGAMNPNDIRPNMITPPIDHFSSSGVRMNNVFLNRISKGDRMAADRFPHDQRFAIQETVMQQELGRLDLSKQAALMARYREEKDRQRKFIANANKQQVNDFKLASEQLASSFRPVHTMMLQQQQFGSSNQQEPMSPSVMNNPQIIQPSDFWEPPAPTQNNANSVQNQPDSLSQLSNNFNEQQQPMRQQPMQPQQQQLPQTQPTVQNNAQENPYTDMDSTKMRDTHANEERANDNEHSMTQTPQTESQQNNDVQDIENYQNQNNDATNGMQTPEMGNMQEGGMQGGMEGRGVIDNQNLMGENQNMMGTNQGGMQGTNGNMITGSHMQGEGVVGNNPYMQVDNPNMQQIMPEISQHIQKNNKNMQEVNRNLQENNANMEKNIQNMEEMKQNMKGNQAQTMTNVGDYSKQNLLQKEIQNVQGNNMLQGNKEMSNMPNNGNQMLQQGNNFQQNMMQGIQGQGINNMPMQSVNNQPCTGPSCKALQQNNMQGEGMSNFENWQMADLQNYRQENNMMHERMAQSNNAVQQLNSQISRRIRHRKRKNGYSGSGIYFVPHQASSLARSSMHNPYTRAYFTKLARKTSQLVRQGTFNDPRRSMSPTGRRVSAMPAQYYSPNGNVFQPNTQQTPQFSRNTNLHQGHFLNPQQEFGPEEMTRTVETDTIKANRLDAARSSVEYAEAMSRLASYPQLADNNARYSVPAMPRPIPNNLNNDRSSYTDYDAFTSRGYHGGFQVMKRSFPAMRYIPRIIDALFTRHARKYAPSKITYNYANYR